MHKHPDKPCERGVRIWLCHRLVPLTASFSCLQDAVDSDGQPRPNINTCFYGQLSLTGSDYDLYCEVTLEV